MAWLNQKTRQRLLGAFVLTALAVIFLPMLLTRTQEPAQVQIDVPDMPTMAAIPEGQVETVAVPEPPAIPPPPTVDEDNLIASGQPAVTDDESSLITTEEPVTATTESAVDNTDPPAVKESKTALPATESINKPTTTQPAKPVAQIPPVTTTRPPVKRLDTASLPISWSVQLASLKNRGNAEKMRDDLRRKGYNAYIRSADGMSKVLVGPLIDRNAANNLCSELEVKQRLKGFVVRFQP